MNKNFLQNVFLGIFTLLVVIFPEMALAGNNQTGNFQEFVTNGTFKMIIDLGLIFLSAFQWFLYWNSWSPENAFKDILTPAVITFLAFNWVTVLGWVGLV